MGYNPFGLPSKKKTEVKQTSKDRERRGKGRSSHTNQNKLRQLKSFYERRFKQSQELKQSKKFPKRTKYFCDKFPTLDNFLKFYPLKEVNVK